jgi:hypothetical protein
MRRRDFLSGGLSFSAALGSRAVFAQGSDQQVRAAVVVGVDKAGPLPKLNGAAAGATSVAAWLRGEGFEVKLLTDGAGPVKASDIFDTVSELVKRGTLDQLVFYFSGHGFLSGYSEFWLLSNAPENPNEAISLLECTVLARETAIPSVIFISDACRSIPDGFEASRIRGSVVFPNTSLSRNVRPAVDQFFAALPGLPSYEVKISESVPAFAGIFTSSFMQAYQSPDPTMVRTVNGMRVVPNRNLSDYLRTEVAKRATAKNIRFSSPESMVLSGDNVYIARVAGTSIVSSASAVLPEIRDVAAFQIRHAGAGDLLSRPGTRVDLNVLVDASSTVDWQGAATDPSGPHGSILSDVIANPVDTLKTHTADFAQAQSALRSSSRNVRNLSSGPTLAPNRRSSIFLFFGKAVVGVAASSGVAAEIVSGSDVPKVWVDLGDMRAASVAFRFNDGSGTVLAALRGFSCSVTVNERGVADANYFQIDIPPDDRIDALHATVAASAQFGVFRIQGDRETMVQNARAFGDTIRVGKGSDPTLGLYAAYAYDQADLIDQVNSVERFMKGDLQTDLFDVAMLGRLLTDKSPASKAVVPFCPLLTQGWGMLRVLRIEMPPLVSSAQAHLTGSLWTTFKPAGIEMIMAGLQQGILR